MLLLASVIGVLREIWLLVGHIQNSSFPKPLTGAQEREYLERMAAGDVSARHQLIERNLRLVAHIIKKFEHTGEEKEDLISIGTIGLIKAINTFNHEKGTRLATYAARCIENEILMFLRANRKNKLEVSLHDPIGVDKEGNEVTLMEVISSNEVITEQVESNLLKEKLMEMVGKLKAREKKVLTMRFGLDEGKRHTQKQIAAQLGISRSYVSRIEKRVIQKLEREFSAR
ncbi:MAG TPA: RNA polymerase sporulation sigma factor SigK [Bacillota bacterium]|jgi:RNA polymerase sporulation-specific sigma factor|nr:RNA polymerase sporulation sigma factor SigK [Bacillota bacterium]HOB86647.1 RNA polymerase sporulation sigma factor SigK [Bacillota bacterium]HOP68692.1 RNA polymerase sporulation sigma factor SigK [Bacillota bacterium]HPT33930.1 RNA polymerase sporulation sigma factor SigK [Bacillota bacterium]HPZ64708.1 RNA polymerase sporulation sigma factor SigK [Bacillota bacterium]